MDARIKLENEEVSERSRSEKRLRRYRRPSKPTTESRAVIPMTTPSIEGRIRYQ
jgi:hypothetical protein